MICVLCNEEIKGDVVNGMVNVYGNNPHPLADEGRCCDDCNMFKVIPARMDRSYIDPVKCVEKKSDKPLSAVEIAAKLYEIIAMEIDDQPEMHPIVRISKILIDWETEIRLDQLDQDEKAIKEIVRDTKIRKN